MKSMPWIIVVCVATLAGHVCIYQNNRIETLKQTADLSEKARKIESDQVRDLFYALRETKAQNETIAVQSFVAGVVDTLKREPEYQKIWHDGYDRGTEVQAEMFAVQTKETPKLLPPKD
jgi:hypothetical protein